MTFYTPLRYPGGKSQLTAWLSRIIEDNDLCGGTYVEPYAGGCGAAIQLLLENKVDRIIINDIDPAIHAFWWSVLHEPNQLEDLILKSEVSIEKRKEHLEILKNPTSHQVTTLGFAAFFLNRTNRSGILTAGVIGGKNQAGAYKIDARFNREDLAIRISRIAKERERITLYNQDALALITSLRESFGKRSLLYLDPPYYVKGSQLYRNFYSPEDHALIARAIKAVKTPWLVTYDDCEAIRALYKDSEMLVYNPYYSTHASRKKASEIMIYDNINVTTAPFLKRCSPEMKLIGKLPIQRK